MFRCYVVQSIYFCFESTISLYNNIGQTNGDVQLLDVDGQPGGIYGRLEIFTNGQWGTICATGFDENDAQVACRQLGFDNYIFVGVTRG